jgi:hypothetical protein
MNGIGAGLHPRHFAADRPGAGQDVGRDSEGRGCTEAPMARSSEAAPMCWKKIAGRGGRAAGANR